MMGGQENTMQSITRVGRVVTTSGVGSTTALITRLVREITMESTITEKEG
jgi:hypothetical protein